MTSRDEINSSDPLITQFTCTPCGRDEEILTAMTQCDDCGQHLCAGCDLLHAKFTGCGFTDGQGQGHLNKERTTITPSSKPFQQDDEPVNNREPTQSNFKEDRKESTKVKMNTTPYVDIDDVKKDRLNVKLQGLNIKDAPKQHKPAEQQKPEVVGEQQKSNTAMTAENQPGRTHSAVKTFKACHIVLKDSDSANLWSCLPCKDGQLMITKEDKHREIWQCQIKVKHDRTATLVNNKYIEPTYSFDDNTAQGFPIAVCFLNPEEICFTMSNQRIIRMPKTGHNSIAMKIIHLPHDCFGIAEHEGKLYISNRSDRIYKYNNEGTLQTTITSNISTGCRITRAHHMMVSTDGTELYIADWIQGLVIINLKDGQVITQMSSPSLKGACDITVDELGNIFVCGYLSNNVVQFNRQGVKKPHVLLQGLKHPSAICFDKYNTNYMVVGDNEKIKLFQLNGK